MPCRDQCRCLGYNLSNERGFSISFLSNRRNFYASINYIFKSGRGKPKPSVGIKICKSRSLPLLTYGTEFSCYSSSGTDNLNVAWNNGLRCIASLRPRSSVAITNLSLDVMPLGFRCKLKALLFFRRMSLCRNSIIRSLANRVFCSYRRHLAVTMSECGISFPLLCVLSKTATKKRVADLFCGACEPYVLENSVFVSNLYLIRRSEFVRAVINHLVRPSFEV